MKKIVSIFLAAGMFLASSCSLSDFFDTWVMTNQKETTDAMLQRLCDGIFMRDAEAVKNEFRYDDVSKIEDFDESVEKLFDYIEGDFLGFERIAGGSEEKGWGEPYEYGVFRSCRYQLNTTMDTYKIIFDYWFHYRVIGEEKDENKIGIECFDIIDAEKDRACADKYYSGDPEGKPGIKFDYKTSYDMDEFAVGQFGYGTGGEFGPVILNSVAELAEFYQTNKEKYSFEGAENGGKYPKAISEYDDVFFETGSLYVAGMYDEDAGKTYIPQWVYIGDFVMARIADWEDDWGDGASGEEKKKGVVVIIELPEKVSSDIPIKILRD